MIRFALLGCGHIAQKHAKIISKHMDDAELTAVCDCIPSKAEMLGNTYRVPWFINSSEMLRQCGDNIDVINILTPSGYHKDNVLELAQYKKHMCVEKPLALRLEDADQMIGVCEQAGVHLFVVKQYRFNFPVRKLYQAIQQGRFGKLIFAGSQVYWSRSQGYYDQADWRGTYKLDGGVLANQASHYLDLLQWLVGDVNSVVAKGTTNRANIETEDTAAVLLEFQNGAFGVLEATTAAPFNLEGSVRIVGTHGVVEISGYQANQLLTWQFTNPLPEDADIWSYYGTNPEDTYGFAHREYLQSVVKTIKDDIAPAVSGREARLSLELMVASYRSMYTNQEIFLKNGSGNVTR